MGIVKRYLVQRLDRPWVRVGLLALTLTAVSVPISLRIARAQAGAALGNLAENVAKLAPPNAEGARQALEVNGFQLGMRVESSTLSPAEAITFATDDCRLSAGMQRAPLDLNDTLPSLKEQSNPSIANGAEGVLVEETGQGTVVACIDTNGVEWLSHDMLERLERFMTNGELAELGVVRYYLVRPSLHGSTIVHMWSEGRAPILKMFPKDGDVPGTDHDFVPRVGGQRMLSAKVATNSVLSYRHEGESVDAVWERLDARLAERGLRSRPVGEGAPGKRAWVGDGSRESLVTVQSVKGTTYLSVFDLP